MNKQLGRVMYRDDKSGDIYHFPETSDPDPCTPVHVLTPDELRAALEDAFRAARVATMQESGEEKEDHLVEGLKFKFKAFTDYLKEIHI